MSKAISVQKSEVQKNTPVNVEKAKEQENQEQVMPVVRKDLSELMYQMQKEGIGPLPEGLCFS